MPAPLLIHIGYHKTGTTFLQRDVFTREDFGFALGQGPERLAATHEFVNREPVSFDPAVAYERFQPLLTYAAREAKTAVISDERLSSIPEAGRYYLPMMIDQLLETFGAFKLLVTIREQQAMTLALYRQAVRSGSVYPLSAFLGTGDEPPGWSAPFKPSFFDYHAVYRYCVKRMGSTDRVCMLPYELLQHQPRDFLARIFTFCGVKGGESNNVVRNRGLKPATTEFIRWTNRMLVRNKLGPDQPWPVLLQQRLAGIVNRCAPGFLNNSIQRRWRKQIAHRLDGLYAESNDQLANELQIDLATLGYDTARAAENEAARPHVSS